MPVKLIFPPFAEHAINGPYLAPALLAKKLNENKIETFVLDFNICFIRKILQQQNIESLLKELNIVKNDTEKSLHIAVLENYIAIGMENFEKYFSPNLLTILQILKKHFFIESDNFLDSQIPINTTIRQIYDDLIYESKISADDTIGFSVAFGDQLPDAIYIAHQIKKYFSGVKLIIGGAQITLLNNEQLERLRMTNLFDVIFVGDALADIISLVQQQKSITIESQIIRNHKQSKFFLDFSFPSFSNLDLYYRRLILPVFTSFGCYWGKCNFCDYTRLSGTFLTKFQVRDAQTVFDEIKQLRSKFPDADFFLVSDAVPPVWYMNLATLAIEQNIKLHTISYLLHSEIYNKDYFEMLDKAGIRAITFGTESLDDNILKRIGKSFSSVLAMQNIIDASGFHFKLIINIIPDIPGTDLDSIKKVLINLKSTGNKIDVLNIQEFALTEGTAMANNPEMYGIKKIQNKNHKTNHGFHSIPFMELKEINYHEKKNIVAEFHQLASKIKLLKRISKIFAIPISDKTIIYVDPSAILDKTNDVICIVSLNIKTKIAQFESPFYSELLSIKSRKIQVNDIEILFEKYFTNSKKTFASFYAGLVHSGIFVKVENTK